MFTRPAPILLSNTVNRRYEFTQIPYLDILTVTNIKRDIWGPQHEQSCVYLQEVTGCPKVTLWRT